MKEGTLPFEKNKWDMLVGTFIGAFNEIELVSMRLWQEFYPGLPFEKNFKTRIDKILFHLNKCPKKIIKQINSTELLIASKRLADKRNTIAHNPIQIQVWHNHATEELGLEIAITSPTDDEYIRETDMEPLIQQAQKLGSELFIYLTERYSSNVA